MVAVCSTYTLVATASAALLQSPTPDSPVPERQMPELPVPELPVPELPQPVLSVPELGAQVVCGARMCRPWIMGVVSSGTRGEVEAAGEGEEYRGLARVGRRKERERSAVERGKCILAIVLFVIVGNSSGPL